MYYRIERSIKKEERTGRNAAYRRGKWTGMFRDSLSLRKSFLWLDCSFDHHDFEKEPGRNFFTTAGLRAAFADLVESIAGISSEYRLRIIRVDQAKPKWADDLQAVLDPKVPRRILKVFPRGTTEEEAAAFLNSLLST